MFTSSRRLLSNELRVISNETFMILCSFVSKKLIAHPSLLTAHGSLYVMLNLFNFVQFAHARQSSSKLVSALA